jgi:hypothetical protein
MLTVEPYPKIARAAAATGDRQEKINSWQGSTLAVIQRNNGLVAFRVGCWRALKGLSKIKGRYIYLYIYIYFIYKFRSASSPIPWYNWQENLTSWDGPLKCEKQKKPKIRGSEVGHHPFCPRYQKTFNIFFLPWPWRQCCNISYHHVIVLEHAKDNSILKYFISIFY